MKVGTLIIGGGAIGLSVAYHLAQRGVQDVLLLERNTLTSGTSWHAAGIVGPLRASANMTRLAMYALELFPRLETETGMSTGYRRTGGYWLARQPERMDELHRIATLGRHFGLDARIVDPATVAVPGLALDSVVGALTVAEDANVNPVDLCMTYSRAAQRGGVTIREESAVVEIVVRDGKACGALLADGTVIEAETVALCAGAWSRVLAETAGVALPLQAVEHMYVVTEPVFDASETFPVIRDLDRGIYIKGDAGRLVIGGFEPDAKCWDALGPEGDRGFLELPEDWDQFAPFMQAALDLMPVLAETGIQRFMNGPESFTADTRPLIGAVPEIDGLYVAAGMNSVGVMSSAGVGRALADWIVDGSAPMDLWEVDVARADPRTADEAHLAARMTEAVADQFALHWPFKQPKAGRDLRQSALHDRWAKAGAVFGLTAGWERGLWYAQDGSERGLPLSVIAPQPWQFIAAREAQAMAEGVALLDLSPFSKFDVSGVGALDALQHLSTANVDREIGRAVYTLFLNAKGGIEADVTVTRLSRDCFRVTSGAATRWQDGALLRRHFAGFDASIADVTEDYAVIGVMGPRSREVLSGLSPTDWSDFPFSTARETVLAGIRCLATRLSFVGELGWEVTVPVVGAGAVFDCLREVGAGVMGHHALDGCRLEKGFGHWGHELGPDVTPLEAELGFAIDWSKDFIGRDALLNQKDRASRRLVLFELSAGPLMLHDEPIFEADRVVGLTTSGGIGPRTGKTLSFGMIDVGNGETKAETAARRFEIDVAGTRYPAQALIAPPYDPKGKRMRA